MSADSESRALTPYLCVADGRAALAWYAEVLGAQVGEPWMDDEGKVGHAEMTVSGCRVFLSESFPDYGVEPPVHGRGAPMSLTLEVDDTAAWLERARAAGATVTREVEEQPERVVATFLDPSGHRWLLHQTR